MKKFTALIISLCIASCLFSQNKIRVFDENKKPNCMVNKDGSYNAYLFIDTLYFENESVVLSRHDGHYYLFSDSSEVSNAKNYNNIIREMLIGSRPERNPINSGDQFSIFLFYGYFIL